MKIIICGIGRVGLSIATYLSTQDNDITVVDNDAYLIKKATDTYDIQGVVGHASQPDVLKKAGAADADIIIAVTDCDEVNMVACQVAHSVFNVRKKIARIRQKEYRNKEWSNLFSQHHMPIDNIISPEEEIAKSIFLRMGVPGTTNDISLVNDYIHLFGFMASAGHSLVGQTIGDIHLSQKEMDFSIPFILRDGQSIEFNDKTLITENDELYIACPRAILLDLLLHLGNNNDIYNGNIIVCGGGVVGEAVCDEISNSPTYRRNNLIIIEKNVARARHLNQKFDKALVLNGSALDDTILEEANVKSCSVFISVMNDDESNILSAIIAKKMGAQYAISLNTTNLYGQLLPDRLIDAIVNPGAVTVSKVLQNLHSGYIKSIQSIRDTGVNIIEAEVTSECKITGIPLCELNLDANIQIIAVYSPENKNYAFSTPKTVINPGDIAIITTKDKNLRDVEQLFSFPIKLFQ